MKKYLFPLIPLSLIVAILFFQAACSDAKSPGSFPEHEKVLQNAAKDGKPVMLYFFSRYCRYCQLMDQEILADKEVRKTLMAFHVLRIDADQHGALARHYSVVGYPFCWFLEGSGKRIIEVPGYVQKPLFLNILEYVRGKHYKTKDIRQYLKKTG